MAPVPCRTAGRWWRNPATRDKLVRALGQVVSNVDRLGEVSPLIEQLGRDHRRFDVVAEHYPAVGASLLATLEHFLGRRGRRSWPPSGRRRTA